METNGSIKKEFEAVVNAAYEVSMDMGRQVKEVLEDGDEQPLSREEAAKLLTKVISVLKQSAERRGDRVAAESLKGDVGTLVEQVLRVRDEVAPGDGNGATAGRRKRLELVSRNGIDPRPVFPRPVFHGREVPMNSGFVKTSDIDLWSENDRLDIHLKQFQAKYGRGPDPQELLDIMLSRMKLPGVIKDDQFEIVALARSIAVNGVRKSPIIDLDGTLLDGNRRLAACHYVLNSDEFDPEQKKRVEYLFVWQLTEHADDDDRYAVVTSLNFEPDYKEDWPEYVKARKVHDAWVDMLSPEPTVLSSKRRAQLKRDLSMRFALGPDTRKVGRYLDMVEWANDFEEHHRNQRGRDDYEVQHRANEYFQYFDELNKGKKPGGVAYALEQDEAFKQTVFDLLYDGKFSNWREIRALKHVYQNPEAREGLMRARSESDPEVGRARVEAALDVARNQRPEVREVGANTRIESFSKFLEELPPRAYRDNVRPENLRRLRDALRLVDKMAATVLGED